MDIVQNPFKTSFLASFSLVKDRLPFADHELFDLDRELHKYEKLFINPDIEKNLISKNELLASFAISKAENSNLTIEEAQEVYDFVLAEKELDFVARKLKEKKKLCKKDYEKLEFFNIVKVFRLLNSAPLELDNFNIKKIKEIHSTLTQGLDVFQKYLPDFTPYKSGKLRDNDKIKVGDYAPPPYVQIEDAVNELLRWYKLSPSITNIAVFHTALYAIHPFNNGNKRVCRIIEHIMFRGLGINSKNLYSTSYYYHKEKNRYYKYLLFSLEKKNLNYFVSFVFESLALSILSVVKTGLEVERDSYLSRKSKLLDKDVIKILKPLVKRRETQFKSLYKQNKKVAARQTFVTYLKKAEEAEVIIKRTQGRNTYYRLNINLSEDEMLERWLKFVRAKLDYIPDDFLLV